MIYLDTDAPDSHQGVDLLLEPVVILLGDLERLGVLRQPGGLLGVALEDREEHHQQRRVGEIQNLAPDTRAQNVQLLNEYFCEYWRKNQTLECTVLSVLVDLSFLIECINAF